MIIAKLIITELLIIFMCCPLGMLTIRNELMQKILTIFIGVMFTAVFVTLFYGVWWLI